MFLVAEMQEDYQGYKPKIFCLTIQFTIEQVILFIFQKFTETDSKEIMYFELSDMLTIF